MGRQHRVRGEHPKIADLLARPEASAARAELDLAAALGRPPSALRGRPVATFYEYDDQGRVARSWQQSEWTHEDRALMLARQLYKSRFHDRCGHPKERAFHPDNDGWFEVTDTFTCWACTAMDNYGHDFSTGPSRPFELLVVSDTRDYEAKPLPPIVRPDVTDEAMGGVE